jgi:Flp pilus assembly pilin Flp
MKSTIREYGLIAVVIVSAMVGYLFYNYNKEAVIDYALDNIGERLVQLLDNESSQDAIRQKFAALKSRILDEEVEGAAVEQMAANVLNLSAVGQPITQDEADMLLNEVMEFEMQSLARAESGIEARAEAEAAAEAAGELKREAAVRAKKEKKVAVELEKLGEKLASAIKTEEELRKMAKLSNPAAPLPPFVVVSSDKGFHFQVDSMMVDVLARADGLEDLKEMEKEKIIVWTKHLAEKRKMNHEQAMVELAHIKKHLEKAKEIRKMTISQTGDQVEISLSLEPEIIEKIRVLKELEAKGVWIPAVPDSIQKIVISTSVAEAPAIAPGSEG